MIRLDLEQGSPEWLQARIGIPTASAYDQILTPKTLKLSTQSIGYRDKILAEWIVGYPLDFGGQSQFMERGTELEPEALDWYEMDQDVDVLRGGFVLRDDRQTGGSPDGLVDDVGGVEIKCPALHTHIGYLLSPELLVAKYRNQVQGYLYLTGRDWWDVVSYHPDLPRVRERIERDEAFITALDAALNQFIADLAAAKKRLEPHKMLTPAEALAQPPAPAERPRAESDNQPEPCRVCRCVPCHPNCPDQDDPRDPVEAMTQAAAREATRDRRERLNRRYFAMLGEFTEWGDGERKTWQEQRVGKASCSDWDVADYERAIALLDAGDFAYDPPAAAVVDDGGMPV